jgi:hypothetical protein
MRIQMTPKDAAACAIDGWAKIRDRDAKNHTRMMAQGAATRSCSFDDAEGPFKCPAGAAMRDVGLARSFGTQFGIDVTLSLVWPALPRLQCGHKDSPRQWPNGQASAKLSVTSLALPSLVPGTSLMLKLTSFREGQARHY